MSEDERAGKIGVLGDDGDPHSLHGHDAYDS
jgi:hypothetical protein